MSLRTYLIIHPHLFLSDIQGVPYVKCRTPRNVCMSLNREKIYNKIKTASFTRESLLVNRPYGFLLPLTTPFTEFRVIFVRFSFLDVD